MSSPTIDTVIFDLGNVLIPFNPRWLFRKMLPDDPIFASYHKLGQFTYKKADGSTYAASACLESIDIGCRAGVIFSPCDLTCGWDGHEHPRGLRVVIDQARHVIVGATFTGPGVQELLHSATVAITAEVPLERLWHAVPSFPTVSEVWLHLLENYGL